MNIEIVGPKVNIIIEIKNIKRDVEIDVRTKKYR
jgi:hypothetical protein